MDETRIDKEYDIGDWCFLSGSESDDSDNDDENDSGDDSFVVLVPCYSPGYKEVECSNNMLLKAQNRRSTRSSGQFD
ncbi:hypothetical protein A2U01_0007891 [Trifolium medium]|uniref:Uncharacterized protein n=1 Tax=Trifolium medium TaxID=97028 RepID=A0A392MHR1_9FABA|nr:hypothetical protein [Trifolium medium]